MKKEKGITLASLIVYIIATITVLSVLSAIIANFTSNLSTLSVQQSIEQKLGKFNLYFIKDVKEAGNEIADIDRDGSWIAFSNGDSYELSNGKIILNDPNSLEIALADNVNVCNFSIDGNIPNKINVYIELEDGTSKTLSYIMGSSNEENNQEEFVYNYVIENKETDRGEYSLTAESTVGLNLLDYRIYGNSPSVTNSLGKQVTDPRDPQYRNYKIGISITNGEEDTEVYIYLTQPLRRVDNTYVDYIDFINKKIVRKVAYIASYNGEIITTPYVAMDRELITGTIVIYGLEEPLEENIELPPLKTFKGADTTYSFIKETDFDVEPSKISISYYKNKK